MKANKAHKGYNIKHRFFLPSFFDLFVFAVKIGVGHFFQGWCGFGLKPGGKISSWFVWSVWFVVFA
jgi:hypothetical protein